MDDSTPVRDLLNNVASKIGKKPSDVDKFVTKMEDNWIENAGAVRNLSDEQWKELAIPLGLVNHIKAALASNDAVKTTKEDVKMAEPEAQIDTSKAEPVMKLSKSEQMLPKFREHLKSLSKALDTDKKKHQESIKTLHKVLENVAINPHNEKFRMLPKGNKGVQEKILAHKDAVAFIELVGFKIGDEHVRLENMEMEVLTSALEAIMLHVAEQGG